MNEFRDPAPADPMTPVRLWPGGPIDVEHYRRESRRTRALTVARALRAMAMALRRLAVRARRTPAPFRAEHA